MIYNTLDVSKLWKSCLDVKSCQYDPERIVLFPSLVLGFPDTCILTSGGRRLLKTGVLGIYHFHVKN